MTTEKIIIDEGEVVAPVATKMKKVGKSVTLKNTKGEDVDSLDYFFNGKVPNGINDWIPVDREDLTTVFDKIFDPKYGFLFYKSIKSEVYLVIVPLKCATVVSAENESIDGDFQKHSLSFINEGSVNPDTLRMKLSRILTFVRLGDN
jgi:hypothetical protein